MKKLYTCIVALATGSLINAQTLTQSNNAYAIGDMFSVFHCDSTTVSPGTSGANAVWNFSAVAIYTNVVNNYTAGPSSSNAYPAGSIDLASSASNQAYLVSSASSLLYYGGNISLGNIGATLNYSAPAVYASYPMSLNTTSSSATGGAINVINPPISGNFTGNSSVLVDGSGTLVLPGGAAGTYTDVLRVVTSQTLNYSAGITGVVTQIIYSYYSPTVKAPLFAISNSSITSSAQPNSPPVTQTTTTIYKNYLQNNPSTGIAVNKSQVTDLLVYPNPSSSLVNFYTENKTVKEVRVYDITGKLVEKQNFSDGGLKLDVSNYNKGIFIYSLLSNDGETLKTGKLTVN